MFQKLFNSNIHIGTSEKKLNIATKGYVENVVKKNCVFAFLPMVTLLKKAEDFLFSIIEQNKKILFIGTPKGFEKEFLNLCNKHKHYVVETWFDGLFTNFSKAYQKKRKTLLQINQRPSLLFVFNVSKHQSVIKEALCLEIPIMAFVNTDENVEQIDYILPANIQTIKGGKFALNFFSTLFKVAKVARELIEKKKKEERLRVERQKQLIAEKLQESRNKKHRKKGNFSRKANFNVQQEKSQIIEKKRKKGSPIRRTLSLLGK